MRRQADSPKAISVTGPKASKPKSEQRSNLWSAAEPSGDLAPDVSIRIATHAHLERLGVETTFSRAHTLKNYITPSYDKRHGLQRAREGGLRRMDGRRARADDDPVDCGQQRSCKG